MKQTWSRSVFPIAAIFSFRMLGLFMLIPVFTIYAPTLQAATPALIGIALGSYGLSQGILQIPFGLLSDRLGRKPMLTLGLTLFILGSLWGALTTSIYGMIAARILQGMGAIGSVLVALLADLTLDEERTKAMAVIGATIGLSFTLAMVISPAITRYFGLSGIFYFTAILAFLGLFLLHVVIPTPKKEPFHIDSETNPKLFKTVISNPHLQRLNVGIFSQHFILTSTFFVLPLLLQEHIAQGHLTQSWHFYLPLMLFSFIAMIPFIVFAERKHKFKMIFLAAVILTALCQSILIPLHTSWFAFCTVIFLYFVVFNLLEASLPSLVSKQANPESKGTAMGIYSSSQFLGIFVGGALAGFIFQWAGINGIFFINTLLACIWFIVALPMQPNLYQTTLLVPFPDEKISNDLIAKLGKIPGVHQVTLASDERIIYLRIDKSLYKPGSAENLFKA
ncbi:MFS transporter [Legionella septentrionalis]|uniref:MFS transporter n=1 Tax=Legionella septentrionalis TaxID=2498109 RepID=UPI000F8EEB28|nr:MFS transporter [Legionella septentrionalis]RUQ98686.1 MFS transporter [Legionella septentrionalis]